jgi:hypothetical protein
MGAQLPRGFDLKLVFVSADAWMGINFTSPKEGTRIGMQGLP